MKNILKSISVLGLFMILTFSSCQSEFNELISDEENLTKATPLTTLLARVSQTPTSKDNVIDSSSCFKVDLPVTVVVNGKEVIVREEKDYALVKNILSEFKDDDDNLRFVFPIKIIFKNFETKILNNPNDLQNVINTCNDDDDDDNGDDDGNEIECLKINFPITISFYNAQNQTPATVTINSNVDLYKFFEKFDNDDYSQINYPISVTTATGLQLIISSNSQLEEAIKIAKEVCDKDDDYDDDDDDDNDNTPISPNFTGVIKDGTWAVAYFFDDEDKTAKYADYRFTFKTDNIVSILGKGTTTTGMWKAYVDDNQNTLEMEFTAVDLKDLGDDWEIIEYGITKIRLKDRSGDDGELDYLTFIKK